MKSSSAQKLSPLSIEFPNALESEKRVLGAIINYPGTICKVQDILREGSFYQPSHEKIYQEIVKIYSQRKTYDLQMIADALETKGILDECGGIIYLMELSNSVATSVNADYHAVIVREKATRRKAIRNAFNHIEDAKHVDLDVLASKAYQDALAITPAIKSTGFRRIESFLESAVNTVHDRMKRRSELRPHKDIQTGLIDLDKYHGGFNRGELIILAARPSEGKTLLAAQIALHVANHGNVAFISCEMTAEEILCRSLGGSIDRIDHNAAKAVLQKANEMQRLQLFFDDSPGVRIDQIAARCERLKIEIGKIDLVVIDYLQLLLAPPSMIHTPRIEKITYLSGECKNLARQMNCSVLLLSQLNRLCEKEDRQPRLSDLRESGSIEQDADIVMFIHRGKDCNRSESGLRELLIEKNRNGKTGRLNLMFSADELKFYAASDANAPDETPEW